MSQILKKTRRAFITSQTNLRSHYVHDIFTLSKWVLGNNTAATFPPTHTVAGQQSATVITAADPRSPPVPWPPVTVVPPLLQQLIRPCGLSIDLRKLVSRN